MTTTNLLKKLAMKNILVIEDKTTEENYNRQFRASANGSRLLVTTQGADVSTIRVAPTLDRDEPESDYFAGSYFDNLTQALRYMGAA